MEDCFETLSGKCFISPMDFKSGFWRIEVGKKSRELTSFKTEDGTYQSKRMPFSLTNGPASFQKPINPTFMGLIRFNLQVSADDVCVATKTWEEHSNILNELLEPVIKSNLKLNPAKCSFGMREVKFLGRLVFKKGIRTDLAKIKAIEQLPGPKDVKEI